MKRNSQHCLTGRGPGALEHRRVNVEHHMEHAHELRARHVQHLIKRMVRTIVQVAMRCAGAIVRWLRSGAASADKARRPAFAQQ